MKSIVQIYNNQPSNSSDFFYRVAQRSREFVKHYNVKWTNIISLHEDKYTIATECDLLIINFVADIDTVPIIQYRKEHNLPTIYEINDNFLAFQQSNPMSSYYNNIDVQAQIYNYIALCDGIQLSSPLMYDELNLDFFAKDKPIVTLKNCIDTTYELIDNEEFIIGWGGSSGHYEDVKSIAPALIAISKKYGIRIAIKSDSKIADLFSEIKNNLIYEPFSTLEDYHLFLGKLTIGICTISQNRFNRTRSDVKFLEYITHGVVPICSDFGPYSDLDDNCSIKFTDDLEQKLSQVIENREQLKSYRENISRYKDQRSTVNAVQENFDFYNTFITIKAGEGEYKEISESTVFPSLYRMLNGEIETPNRNYNNATFYYAKFKNDVERILYAIENIDSHSLILKKRYIELLCASNNFDEAILQLKSYMKLYPGSIDFIIIRLIIAQQTGENSVINGLKLRLKKISPLLFHEYFGGSK